VAPQGKVALQGRRVQRAAVPEPAVQRAAAQDPAVQPAGLAAALRDLRPAAREERVAQVERAVVVAPPMTEGARVASEQRLPLVRVMRFAELSRRLR